MKKYFKSHYHFKIQSFILVVPICLCRVFRPSYSGHRRADLPERFFQTYNKSPFGKLRTTSVISRGQVI